MYTLVRGCIVLCIGIFSFLQPIVVCRQTNDSNVNLEDSKNVKNNFPIDETKRNASLNNSNNDNCTSSHGSTKCGQVVICKAAAITISDVKPRVSLFSGGTTLTIRGTNVDKLHPYEFIIDNTDNNTLVDCKNISNTEIVCRTPPVNNSWNTKSIEYTISHSPRYCHTASKFSVVFQTEPKFLPLDSRKDVSIVDSILVLYGENLPQELQNDIEVKVGGINCMVLDVNKHSLSCNASTLMDFSKEHFEIYNTVYSSASPSPGTRNVSSTVISSNEPEQQTTRKSLITVTGPALKKPAGSAKKFSVPVSESNEQFDGSPISRGTDTYVCYNVSVTIGNYHSDLGELKVYRKIHYDVHRNDIWTVLVICSVLLVITVVVILLFVIIKRKHTQRKLDIEKGKVQILGDILHDIVTETKQESMKEFILQSEDISLGDLIGTGNFGCVYEGTLTKDQQTVKVAVKTLQDKTSENLDFKNFILEAVVMKDFRHPNVLQLLGLVEKELGVPYVILPYMDNGDLLTYIRRESVCLSLHDVIKFGADIASGMAYLSSLKFVHRDLAARNCMLDSSYTVKVADFGLCRDIYEKGYYSSDNKKMLPIRWMAIESIEHGSYSTKSDVWSLGVVLWEMLTRGVTPYPGVDGWDIINYLRHRRLSLPFFCPSELYYLMMLCWAKNPQNRPDFTIIQRELLRMIGQASNQQAVQRQWSEANPEYLNSVAQQNETGPRAEEAIADTNNSTPMILANQTPAEESVTLKIKLKEHECHTTIEEDNIKLKEQPQLNEDPERCLNQYILLLSKMSAEPVKNVDITFPECWSDREVSTSAAGVYSQLVDQYEKLPNFKRTDNTDMSGVNSEGDKITGTRVEENDKFNKILSNTYFILEPSQ